MNQNIMTWAKKIIHFLHHLDLDESILPENIRPLYPLKGEKGTTAASIVHDFYNQFYSDDLPRKFIIGINPGRLGAGSTGVPFTDTKRLSEFCGIEVTAFKTHEPSSVFIYEMIGAYGGPRAFYSQYYLTAVCPIGFIEQKPNGNWLNYNYYDNRKLTAAVEDYMISKMKLQIGFGADTSVAYCLGTGKNYNYFNSLNKRTGFFKKVIPLEHPRYIMQYRNRSRKDYIEKYLAAFSTR